MRNTPRSRKNQPDSVTSAVQSRRHTLCACTIARPAMNISTPERYTTGGIWASYRCGCTSGNSDATITTMVGPSRPAMRFESTIDYLRLVAAPTAQLHVDVRRDWYAGLCGSDGSRLTRQRQPSLGALR